MKALWEKFGGAMASLIASFIMATFGVIANNHIRNNQHQVEIAEIKKDHESDLKFLSYRIDRMEVDINNKKVASNEQEEQE